MDAGLFFTGVLLADPLFNSRQCSICSSIVDFGIYLLHATLGITFSKQIGHCKSRSSDEDCKLSLWFTPCFDLLKEIVDCCRRRELIRNYGLEANKQGKRHTITHCSPNVFWFMRVVIIYMSEMGVKPT